MSLKKNLPGSDNRINVFTEDIPAKSVFIKTAETYCRKVLEVMNETGKEITLILCSDRYIHGINREYREKDRPTDVISFAYRENGFRLQPGEYEQLGDIFLSIDRLREQAVEYGVTENEEMLRLVIHSVLHLFGFDHEKDEAEAM